MSKDQMAGMLLEANALSKVGLLDNEENRKKLQYLKEHGGSLEAINELGKDELDRQMKSASVQERFTQSVEKLKELFVGIAEPLMPVLDVFAKIVTYISQSETALLALQTVMAGLAMKSIVTAIASIFTGSAVLGPVGLGIAAVATAGMMAAITMGQQKVKDGIAPSSKGPFTITDNYGATAVTTDGDNLVVSPNVTRTNNSIQNSNTSKNTVTNISSDNGSISILSNTLGNKMDQMIGKLDTLIYTMKNGMVINLDGNRVSQELGTPMAITTRNI